MYVLRDQGMYVKDSANNTTDISEARKFDTYKKALNYKFNNGIGKADIVEIED